MVKALNNKVQETADKMQVFLTSFSDLEINQFMLKVDKSINDLQSKATHEDIQLAIEDARSVMFQKIHELIALCSKKNTCTED